MGRDKATIEVDGSTMAARVAAALRAAGAAEVALVGGEAGDVPDEHPGEGPLGGVLTALGWSGGRTVVVAPCDLATPDPAAFAALAAAAPAVPALDRPLPLALPGSAAAVLADAFAAGERSLRRAVAALPGLAVVAVAPAAVADADLPADLPPGAR